MGWNQFSLTRQTEGFRPDSNYWLADCLPNCEWEKAIREHLYARRFLQVEPQISYRLPAGLPSVPVGIVVTLAV